MVFYYYWEWRSIHGFVTAIDHCDRPLYDYVHHYLPMGRVFFQTKRPVEGFYYSAFFALLLVPFGWLSDRGAPILWGAFQVLCLLILLAVPHRRLLGLRTRASYTYPFLVAISLPLFHNLAWGQVSVLVVTSLLLSFDAYMAKKRILAGCLLAFAAAINYYPLLFIVYLLVKRDIRSLGATCLAGILFFAVIPVVAMGLPDWLAFEAATKRAMVNASSWIRSDPNSQYIAHVGIRYVRLFIPYAANETFARILAVLGLVVAALNTAVVWQLQRRRVPGETGLSLVALWLTQPFLIGTSWPHYFCFLPFCQALLLERMRKDWRATPRSRILFALTILSVISSSVLLFNCFRHWITYSWYGLLFIATALLLPPLYWIASGDRVRASPDSRARYGPRSGSGRLQAWCYGPGYLDNGRLDCSEAYEAPINSIPVSI